MCICVYLYLSECKRERHIINAKKRTEKRVRNAVPSCPCYKWWGPTASRDSSSSSSLFLSEAFYSSATCHGKRSKTMLHIRRLSVRLSLCLGVCLNVGGPRILRLRDIPENTRAGKPAASFFTRRLHNDWQFIMPASSLLGSLKHQGVNSTGKNVCVLRNK